MQASFRLNIKTYFRLNIISLRDTALILLGLSVFVRRSLGRIFAIAQMRTTAKHGFAAYSLEDSLQTKKEQAKPVLFCLERETRFELATFALARQRSTTEPFPHSGGNNRARTYDPLLVRQMLSQLSYAPVTLNAYIL